MSLAQKICVPCRGDMPRMTGRAIALLAAEVPAWTVVDDHHIQREFRFQDFKAALALVVAIGAEAEAQGHHPDLTLSWGRVGVMLFTHKIDGLAEADFIMAARIDRIAARSEVDR